MVVYVVKKYAKEPKVVKKYAKEPKMVLLLYSMKYRREQAEIILSTHLLVLGFYNPLEHFSPKTQMMRYHGTVLPPSGGYTQSCAQTKIKFARIPDQKKGATDETQLCV